MLNYVYFISSSLVKLLFIIYKILTSLDMAVAKSFTIYSIDCLARKFYNYPFGWRLSEKVYFPEKVNITKFAYSLSNLLLQLAS